jgi:2-C-methyl-D-erythritol 4-phosphate cytidylyltransferase
MELAVIIAAAGSSSRYTAAGGVRHKLEEDLGGKTVLQRAVEVFSKHDLVRTIIVAGPAGDEEFTAFRARHGDRLSLLSATLVRGAEASRGLSVRAALDSVPESATHIAVHDAARPCLDPLLLDRILDMASQHDAVVPAVECADTVKRIVETDEPALRDDDPVAAILGAPAASAERLRVVTGTVDRAGLVLVQTPQVFRAGLLRAAYAQKDLTSTDDAGLVERLGTWDGKPVRIAVCRGDPRNLKITVPEDIPLARALLNVKPPESRSNLLRF